MLGPVQGCARPKKLLFVWVGLHNGNSKDGAHLGLGMRHRSTSDFKRFGFGWFLDHWWTPPLCPHQCLSRRGHASVRDAFGQNHTGWALHTCDGPPRGSDLSAPVVLRKTHSMSIDLHGGSSSYKFLFCPWDGTRCALRARPQASTRWRPWTLNRFRVDDQACHTCGSKRVARAVRRSHHRSTPTCGIDRYMRVYMRSTTGRTKTSGKLSVVPHGGRFYG